MMKAGRELDALVASKVMGYSVEYIGNDGTVIVEDGKEYRAFSPSTDIAAAWQVWDRLAEMTDDGWTLLRESKRYTHREERWSVHDSPFNIGDYPSFAEADTAPLAICMAALKAIGCKHGN